MRDEPVDDPSLFAWLAAVDRQWRRAGIATTRRLRLRGDLERDLAAALDSGATVAELTTDDPVEFAERVAQATDWPPPARRQSLDRWRTEQRMGYGNVVSTCLAGALVGAVVSAYLVFPNFYVMALPELVAALLVDVISAGVALACALAAVVLRFRDDPAVRSSLPPIGVGLALGGALSIAPTMTLAHAFDYTDDAPVVLCEVALVVLCCAAGILAGRWVATQVSPMTQPGTSAVQPR